MTQSFTAKNEKPMAAYVVNHFGRPFGEICRRQKWEDCFCIYFGNPSRTDSYKGLKFSTNIPNRLPMGGERVSYD